MSQLSYRPEIDGLRAVAVLAVVMFHAGLGCAGGYVGVDVFFVISGFLITSLILRAQDRDDFRLRDFWLRRIRRLFPAMAVMQVSVLMVGAALMLPRELEELGRSSVAQVLLHANTYFAGQLDYFAGPAELKPLLHTWSLAVEEQFYLLLPLLLIALHRLSRPALRRVLLALAIISFALSTWGLRACPTENFFWLPFRAWELLLGGLLACVPAVALNRTRNNALSAVGLAGILWSILSYDALTPFPGPAAFVPCACTALVIYAAEDNKTFAHRLLASRPLVGIGLISYSLYLFHWPVIAFTKLQYGPQLTGATTVLVLAVSFFLGYASWKWVETPFRRGGLLVQPRRLVLATVACAALMITTSVGFSTTNGLPQRWEPEIRQVFATGESPKGYVVKSVVAIQENRLPTLGEHGPTAEKPTLLVWGDSHAHVIGELCNTLAKESGITGYVAARGGVVPLLGTWRSGQTECVEWNDAVLDFVRRQKIRNVLLVSRWAIHVEKRFNGLDDTLIKDAHSSRHSHNDSLRALKAGLSRTLSALGELDVNVWVLKQVPAQPGDPVRQLVWAIRNDGDVPDGVSLDTHRQRQRRADKAIDQIEFGFVRILDPARQCFDAAGRSRIGTLEQSFYADDNHLSAIGAEALLRPVLQPVFRSIARTALAEREARRSVTR